MRSSSSSGSTSAAPMSAVAKDRSFSLPATSFDTIRSCASRHVAALGARARVARGSCSGPSPPPGLEHLAPRVVANDPGERRVLPELSPLGRHRGQRIQEPGEGAIEEVAPLFQPEARLATSRRFHLLEVPASELERALGITNDLTRGRVGEPEAALLIPRHALGAGSECIEIAASDAAMGPDRGEGEVASAAEIDDVLARRVEQRGRLARGDQLIGVHGGHGVVHHTSHISSVGSKHNKHNRYS
jgi:hypothetical protein